MSAILDLVKGRETREFGVGQDVISQGQRCGVMLVLIEGQVEILRDEVRVSKAAQSGVLFGEMAVLLRSPATATVRTLTPAKFVVIENPREFLENSSQASLHVAELLANRLDALTRYLADVKRQYEGHDHIGMVDGVLEALMHRQQPRA
jgi:CRP/FNR family transcriptional regulator, cyclic AMP receptor protein